MEMASSPVTAGAILRSKRKRQNIQTVVYILILDSSWKPGLSPAVFVVELITLRSDLKS